MQGKIHKILIITILSLSYFGTNADSTKVFRIEKASPFVQIDEAYLQMFFSNEAIDVKELHKNSSKYFQKKAKLNPKYQNNWVRFELENVQNQVSNFILEISIRWHSEVYVFSESSAEPIHMQAGVLFPDQERTFALNGLSKVPLQLPVGKFTVYINFRDLASLDKICDCTFSLWLMEAKATMKNIMNYRVVEGIFLGIILIMTLYNGIIYFFTKDTSYKWYVLCLLCITGYSLFGNNFRNLDWFVETHTGVSHLLFLSNLSMVFASFCFLHFSRHYLQNSRVLNSFWEKFLNIFSYYQLFVNTVLDVISWQSSLGYFGKNWDMSLYININYAVMLLSLLWLSLRAMRSKEIVGKYYFYANSLVFIFSLVELLSDKFLKLYTGNIFTEHSFKLGISLQLAVFSIALAQRIQSLKKQILEEKLAKEKQARGHLEEMQKLILAQNEILEAKVKERTHQLEQSNEEIKTQNQHIQEQAKVIQEHNSRELMNKTLQILQKNETLSDLLKFMEKIKPHLQGDEEKQYYKATIRTIKESIDADKQWEDFKEYFEKVYPTLFSEMYRICPTLTQNDLRLCAYMQMGLNRKEIAQMLNINTESVRKHIYRLRQKLGRDFQEID
ncbi:MAG: hypothetical protein OHK0045_15340 [Raineya sp.]